MLKILSFLMAGALGAAAVETNSVRHSCCAAPETADTAPIRLTDKSLYQLDSTWTNDCGTPFKLASLRGRPQIVAMFFANCSYACPLLVFQMKQIEALFLENQRPNVNAPRRPRQDRLTALRKGMADALLSDP